MNDVREVIQELLKLVSDLDNLFQKEVSDDRPVYGLHIIPGIVLLLKHQALIITRYSAKELFSTYDHYLLILPELLSIRAIRFTGKEKLDGNKSFRIKKLMKQKGEKSRIAEELIGSFITYGMLENINLAKLQLFSTLWLSLMRPLLKQNVVLPSPLSLIAHEYKTEKKKIYLSPCTLTLVLNNKNFDFKKDFQVIGEYLKGLFIKNNIALAFDKQTNKLQKIGYLKVFLPLEEFADNNFNEYYNYLKSGQPIITNLLGMLIFEEDLPFIAQNTRGFFLALQETSFYPEIQAFALYGEPSVLNFRISGRIIQKYYAIRCMKDNIIKFKQTIREEIFLLSRKLDAYNILEKISFDEAIKEGILSEYLLIENNYIEMLSSCLMVQALVKEFGSEGLLKALNVLRNISSSSEIDASLKLLRLKKEKSYIYEIFCNMNNTWKQAFDIQQTFAKKWNLAYII